MTDLSVHETLSNLVIGYADEGLSNGEIFEKLEGNYPEVVDEYVATFRPQLVKRAIWTIVGQSNSRRRKAIVFAEVSELRRAGEQLLLNSLPVEGGRKTLVQMTKEDLLYSAALDEDTAAGLISHADFKRAVAKRVPKGKTVGDVFTAEKIAEFAQRLGLS